MTDNPEQGSNSSSTSGRGRARLRSVPTRTVMVFPTRDGDHITVTISVGKYIHSFFVKLQKCSWYESFEISRNSSIHVLERPAPVRRVRFAPNFEGLLSVVFSWNYINPKGFQNTQNSISNPFFRCSNSRRPGFSSCPKYNGRYAQC